MQGPSRMAVGADGALWFTNYSDGSIGRITSTGVVSNFTDPSIQAPLGIAAGSDGALWFTNWRDGSIGRITTDGVVSNYDTRRSSTPGRSPLARTALFGLQVTPTARSGASPPMESCPTTPTPPSATQTRSQRARMAPCGSPTRESTPSGASPPRVRSPTLRTRASTDTRDHDGPRRRPVVHERQRQFHRTNHPRR